MPNATRTLPAPTWHGLPEGVETTQRKYIDFVERHARNQTHDRPTELRAQIARCEDRVRVHRARIKDYNTIVQRRSNELATLQAQGDIDDTVLEQLYVQLIAMPEVIGTRLGDAGELVIMIRPLRPDGIDLGDFEITWRTFRDGDSKLILVRDPGQMYNFTNSFWRSRYDARRVGNVSQPFYICEDYRLTESITDLLSSYSLPSTVRAICDALTGQQDVYQDAKHLSAETEARWTGYEGNFIVPFRRLVEVVGAPTFEERIEGLEQMIANHRQFADESLTVVNNARQELRNAKAELEKLEAAPKRDTLTDPAESLRELRYLTTGIPGIMGIRFDHDGTPVFHFRNSYEYQGRRYDLGDFELFFRSKFDSVLELHMTRVPKDGGYRSLYWHPAHPRSTRADSSDWFCFGGRSSTLLDLFQSGQFGHFLSVLVNTMSSVNAGSEYNYTVAELEIPFSELWHHTPRTRPRRRRRSAVLSLLDAMK